MNRRTFLKHGACSAFGLAGSGVLAQALGQEGNQAAGMINPNTQQRIDGSLAWLATQQHADGSFGNGSGNHAFVCSISLTLNLSEFFGAGRIVKIRERRR